MHREEEEREAPCAECGAVVVVAVDRGFAFGEAGVLCFECALKRGGRFDADEERWTVDPRVSDLLRDYRP